jgi:hypothetical protein
MLLCVLAFEPHTVPFRVNSLCLRVSHRVHALSSDHLKVHVNETIDSLEAWAEISSVMVWSRTIEGVTDHSIIVGISVRLT